MNDVAEQRIAKAKKDQDTTLDLSGLDLYEVPDSLRELTVLTRLDLSNNELTLLPDWLAELTELMRLDLRFNDLTAVPDNLVNLGGMKELILGYNRLTAVPDWIGELTGLTRLDLSMCGLDSVPEWLRNLSGLTQLDLRSNDLTTVPNWIGEFSALARLDLTFCGIRALPDWIGGLTDLTHLGLGRCGLTSVPDWLRDLGNLKYLDLHSNQLTALPEWLGDFTYLNHLDLGANALTSVPNQVGGLIELSHFDLGGNKLEVAPDWIGNLTKLNYLGLGASGLTVAPEWIENLTELTHLDLRGNDLRTLPEWSNSLAGIQFLNLRDNSFEGMPECLRNLSDLTDITLGENHLQSLPDWLGELTGLTYLDLSATGLTTVPDLLHDLNQLSFLNLSDNSLGSLPNWMGNLVRLKWLHLHNCELTEIPDSITNLTKLKWLGLRNNNLKSIPNGLSNLSRLRFFHLTGNGLKTMPHEIGNLRNLEELHLDNNELNEIPEAVVDLGNLTNLRRLDLDNNRLKVIPDQIGNLTNLTRLHLDGNELTAIPDAFGNLTNLRRLDLDKNQLKAVPDQLSNLTNLTELYLDNNELSEIPESLGDLTALDRFDVRGNDLPPEATAVAEHGAQALLAFLRALQTDGVTVRQAKLVLIGEGAVGKSSLLAAMLGEPFVEDRKTTHGVEVKPLKLTATDGSEIELNAWDFGGQRTYRPSHQFFFTSPAIYVVAWNPRLGALAGCVDEWVNLVRHRVGDSVRIHIVATHSDPHGQLGDLDEDRLLREHGNCIAGFHRIDSSTGQGIAELKAALTETVSSLPHLERRLPARWQQFLNELNSSGDSHLDYRDYLARAERHDLEPVSAHSLALVATELGHWCYYPQVVGLSDLVVLQGDWLSRAVSLVLNDSVTKDHLGLVTHGRLSSLWDNPDRPAKDRYPRRLHQALRLLMREYQIAYDVQDAPAVPSSLISQLVPTTEPDLSDWEQYGPNLPRQTYIIKFLDSKRKAVIPEGLMYQLITWFHRFSLGRQDFSRSLHWAQGLVLDDRYNGRALIRVDDDALTVEVKAASPNYLCNMISNDICNYISDWKGLKPTRLVTCGDRCVDPGQPWTDTSPFDIEPLQRLKAEGRDQAACGACHQFVPIDVLLGDGVAPLLNASTPTEDVLAAIYTRLGSISDQITDEGVRTRSHVSAESDSAVARLSTQVEEQTELYLRLFADDAAEGPRLFTVESNDIGARIGKLAKRRIRVVLWCEHSRLPVHVLDQDPDKGVYSVDIDREWLAKARPWLGIAAQVLRLGSDFVPSLLKINLEEEQWKSIEDRLDLAQAAVKELSAAGSGLADSDSPGGSLPGNESFIEPTRGHLQTLHTLLREQDADYAGLQRVRDRDRFLWVHQRFAGEYD